MTVQTLATAIIALVSVGSLILGIINHRRQNRYAKTQHELNSLRLQREQESIEAEQRAKITLRHVKLGRNEHRIRLANIGKSHATDVTFELVNDGGWYPFKDGLPLEILDAGESVDIPVSVSLGSDVKVQYRVIWNDNTGHNTSNGVLVLS